MFDLGWTEMLLVGIVALIVVGPKDLPGMFRAVGEFTGKAKAMAREFSRAMNEAADQSGMSEIEKTIRAASNPKKFGVDSIRKAGDSALSPERQATKDKVEAAAAKRAEDRRAAEEAAAEEEADELLLDEDLAPPAEQPREESAKPDPQAPAPKPSANQSSEAEADTSAEAETGKK